jgi:hypothetical protein
MVYGRTLLKENTLARKCYPNPLEMGRLAFLGWLSGYEEFFFKYGTFSNKDES